MNELVQLRYHEKHVPHKPNSIGGADKEISAAHRVREERVLSGMQIKKGRPVRGAVSVPPLPGKILPAVAHMAWQHEIVV